jgi:hypothetical protein
MQKPAALPRAVRLVAALLLACLTAACWGDPSPTDAVARCASSMFPSYNPKDKDQCIAACIKCERGVVTTCATSCSLKGAK